MTVTDSIGDLLTRIRNAIRAKQETVEIPSSNVKLRIAKILFDEGFVSRCEELTRGSKKVIKITLKYRENKKNIISNIERVSTPGRHMYVTKNRVPMVLRGFGIAIVSNSSGIMTDNECRKLKIGGEILCKIW